MPKLLLDVDGVLSPFSPINSIEEINNPQTPEGFWTPSEFPWISVSDKNIERIKRLSESFELIWCTGWLDRANDVISPLHHLPDLPVVPVDYCASGCHWKINAIEEFVGSEPFAFIDDEITRDAIEWAKKRTDEGSPTLFVRTNPVIGMTDEHVERLLSWADSLTALDVGHSS